MEEENVIELKKGNLIVIHVSDEYSPSVKVITGNLEEHFSEDMGYENEDLTTVKNLQSGDVHRFGMTGSSQSPIVVKV